MRVSRLTYISTCTRPLSASELVQLGDSAAAFNAVRNVSGVLLYNSLNFLQTIEGTQADLEAAIARILRDPRHTGIVVLNREHDVERSFPDWSMRLLDQGDGETRTDGWTGRVAEHLIRLYRSFEALPSL